MLGQEVVKQQFHVLANELSVRFPELDLRFNLQSGTNRLRLKAASVSHEVIELPLGEYETDELLYAAMFRIKEIARLYDD